VSNVKRKIEEYQKSDNTVIFTRDTHEDNYLQTQEGKKLPVPHCIKNTKGWEISSQLNTNDSIVINKPTFGSIELMNLVSVNYSDSEFELIGLCTDICVISNAMLIKTILPEVSVTVDTSCCAGVTPESHKNALNAMKMCQINIIGE
jgi:nicotinamidase-related amidase